MSGTGALLAGNTDQTKGPSIPISCNLFPAVAKQRPLGNPGSKPGGAAPLLLLLLPANGIYLISAERHLNPYKCEGAKSSLQEAILNMSVKGAI